MQKPEILTTDEFNRQLFRPHGRVAFAREGQVLVCEAIGPFNKELVEAVVGVTANLIAEMTQHGKWGAIIEIRKSALASSEVLAAYTAYLQQLVAAGVASCITAMVIAHDVEGCLLMQQHFVKAYADAGLLLAVFENVGDAKTWVASQLA